MSRKFIKFFLIENPDTETISLVDWLNKAKEQNEQFVDAMLSMGRDVIANAQSDDIPEIVREIYGRIAFAFPNMLSCSVMLDVKNLTDYDNAVAKLASQNNVSVNPIHQLFCCEEFVEFCLGEEKSYNALKIDELRQLVSTIQDAVENPVKGQEMGNKWVFVNPSDILHTRNLVDAVISAMEDVMNNGKEAYLLCVEQYQ